MAIPALQLPFGRTAAREKSKLLISRGLRWLAATPNGGWGADQTDRAAL
jgi:hypothetical protein